MSTEPKIGKIELKAAELSFVAEGEQEWLAAQLDKVLAALSAQRLPAKSK